MKPYILNYSETIDLKNTAEARKNTKLDINFINTTKIIGNVKLEDSVVSKENIINMDEFQFYSFGGTWVTESIEPSDDDEIAFMRDSTELTFVREPDDEDEINFMPDSTLMTKSIEPSDEDEVFFDSFAKQIALI